MAGALVAGDSFVGAVGLALEFGEAEFFEFFVVFEGGVLGVLVVVGAEDHAGGGDDSGDRVVVDGVVGVGGGLDGLFDFDLDAFEGAVCVFVDVDGHGVKSYAGGVRGGVCSAGEGEGG